MRLQDAWIGNQGLPIVKIKTNRQTGATSKVSSFQVRWRFEPLPGRIPKECKDSSFPTKARAKVFIEELWKAHHRQGNWRFDVKGRPTDTLACDHTVLRALEEYVDSRWHAVWKAKTRTRVIGRLMELVAVTLSSPKDRIKLSEALAIQRFDRGIPPAPSTVIEWAARWLREDAFTQGHNSTDPNRIQGRAWIEARSMPITDLLNTAEVARLRSHFTDGRPYNTQRSYWKSSITPFLAWLHQTEKLSRSPLLGDPPLARDIEAEKPDPSRIPDPGQLAEIAQVMGAAHGEAWADFVLVTGHCALRASEALALRFDAFERVGERVWVLIAEQEIRTVAAHSDTGTTRERSLTKSRRGRTPRTRRIPVAKAVADRLIERYGDLLGESSDYLFQGPRGAIGNYDTVREWWHQAVDVSFPPGNKLNGIQLHSMRHAGMTYWLTSGHSHKRVMSWGGWTSLVQMLDTYAGWLDSEEEGELDRLDAFIDRKLAEHKSSNHQTDPSPSTQGAEPNSDSHTGSGALVVQLDEYRQKRLR